MKFRTYFILPAMLIGLFFFSAYTPVEDADKILLGSKAKFESLSDFSAGFIYSITKGSTSNARKLEKTGSIVFKKDKYHITQDDIDVICNGNTQWIYNRTDNEVNISDYDPEEALNIEFVFQVYEANGKSRYDGIETINSQSAHKITLFITDEEIEYNQVTLWINQKTKLVERANLKDRNQTNTLISFKNVKINQGVSDKKFEFDAAKHPGVEIYDDRY